MMVLCVSLVLMEISSHLLGLLERAVDNVVFLSSHSVLQIIFLCLNVPLERLLEMLRGKNASIILMLTRLAIALNIVMALAMARVWCNMRGLGHLVPLYGGSKRFNLYRELFFIETLFFKVSSESPLYLLCLFIDE